MSAITIMDYLAQHVAQQPDKLALICVDAKSAMEWSYSALYEKVLEVASHIQRHATPGERALILMDTGIDYVASFLACQYVGVTAIPSYPPESIKPQHLARTIGITENAQATLVLTTSRFSETVSLLCERVSHCQMMLTDSLGVAVKPAIRYEAKTEDIAFLQYTSGSTAKPKGVMISHGNLIANERVIMQRMETTQKDVMVSWLPLFHDMGLIGGLLQPLFVGYPLVLTSPRYFMERPLRWLQLLSDYQGTISGGPDFSFRLCLERVNPTQLAALDLSHWRVAYSGAEPIRHDTLLDFADKYASCGFSKAALYPCYGLAEGTLMVSGSHPYTGACIQAFSNQMLAEGKALAVTSQDLRNTDAYSHQVSCGIAGSDHDIRIVCPTTFAHLADGLIGEVWTAGPSIALGYWQNESATNTTFVMHDGKRWLRTGDVGYLWQEQLFISGRRKDLIISNGHNIYPQDIERAIEANLSFVRKGRVAAFPVPSGETGEGIGLAIEVVTTHKNEVCPTQTAQIIRDFIISHFSTTPELVLLLEQGTLPKTSSGKLQRSACLRLFQLNKLSCYADFDRNKLQSLQVTPQTRPTHWLPLQLKMAELWQQVLRYPIQSDDVDFFALGGSSIKAAQLMAEVQHTFGCQLPSSSLFNAPQFAAFCQLVQHLGQAESTVPALQAHHNSHYPLSAQQLRQLFLWQLEPQSSAYHIGAAFYLHGNIDVTLLRQACEQVFAQHQVLSHAYVKNQNKGWQQSFVPQQLDWQERDYTGQTKALAQASRWLNEFGRAPFALNEGKNIRVAVVRVSEKNVIWSMVMHHIAGDAWSFEIM